MLSFTIGKTSIALFFDGDFYSIDQTHINYEVIRDELKKPVGERCMPHLAEWLNVKNVLTILTAGHVTITDEGVLYAGEEVNNYMTGRMMGFLQDAYDMTPWALFMDNLYQNPARYVHDELYEWMERAEMPITPEGNFLAFKKVRDDYTDCHTGSFDNSPGAVLEMPRDNCDPDRTNHCSTGFHFCSVGYLPKFWGDRVIVVEINPKDVTSIPNDYGFTKGRCCRYKVVGELTSENAAYARCWNKTLGVLDDPTEFPTEVVTAIEKAKPIPSIDDVPAKRQCFAPRTKEGALLDLAARKIEEETTDANKPTITNKLVFITTTDKSFGEMDVRQAVGRHGGSIRAAARDLGINESTLRGWVKKLEN